MTEFNDRMRSHFAQYKKERLGVTEDGIASSQGRAYQHILPESLFRLNIIEPIRREFWTYYDENRATLSLHKDFHHLNSSQAFAFNLLFPWFELGDPSQPFLEALGYGDRSVAKCRFEHMPDQAEGTVVDFYIEFTDRSRLLIEVKLTESTFGQQVPNERHKTKHRETYLKLLTPLAHPGGLEEATFFLNYQLFRNVSKLDLSRGDTFMVLMPRANALTWAQGEAFRGEMLQDHARPAMRMVAVEDVVGSLKRREAALTPLQATVVSMLAEKYMLVA